MRITFWGTRGSIAQSGTQTLRYGGHTSCVEIRSDANDLLILDGGTGLQGLSHSLMRESTPPRTTSILISHTHWDHIQGLPFFAPFYVPNQQWSLYGPASLSQDLESILRGQMQQTYFPITPEIFNANMDYHNVVEGSFNIGDIKVTTRYLNHPGVALGYRIEVDGYTVIYATDHEPHDCRLAHGGAPIPGSEDDLHGQFLAHADYVIHDTQYLAHEYEQYRGWGHSTVEYVVDLAHRAHVKTLALYHHDPLRTDEAMDDIVEMARARVRELSGAMEVIGASENIPIVPPTSRKVIAPRSASLVTSDEPKAAPQSGITDQPLLPNSAVLYVASQSSGLSEIISAIGLHPIEAHEPAALHRLYTQHRPRVIILQVSSFSELRTYYDALFESAHEEQLTTVAILCRADECFDPDQLLTFTPQPIRLVEPITDIYLSSRIQTWIQRAISDKERVEVWERAHIPTNEAARAERSSRLLDQVYRTGAQQQNMTTLKKRTQELIEIAWQMMAIPEQDDLTVVMNLLTADTQETVAASPISYENSCSRDISICSHVIAQEAPIYAFDVSQDPILKTRANFTHGSSYGIVGTYIGLPLRVGGYVVGTLSCQGPKPTQFNPRQLEGLKRIASLLEGLLQDEVGD